MLTHFLKYLYLLSVTITIIDNVCMTPEDNDIECPPPVIPPTLPPVTDPDCDPSGETVTEIVSQPSHGSVTLEEGVFYYSPDLNYHGPDSYEYKLCYTDPDCPCTHVTGK